MKAVAIYAKHADTANVRERGNKMVISCGRFYHISDEQIRNDFNLFPSLCGRMENKKIEITLPMRSTTRSAGYDFFSPISFKLSPNEEICIPMGVGVELDEGWMLLCVPKSGLGFKYYTRLANTVGVIDGDYFFAKNEGHIHLKIRNESYNKTLFVNSGDKIMQGIFVPYGITYDDDATGERTGGFGSTGK